jgi:hypothetical protein
LSYHTEIVEGGPHTLAGWPTATAIAAPIRALWRYLRDLRPAWWALRGYLLVALLLAALTQGSGFRLHTFGYYAQALNPPGTGGRRPAWLLAVAAVVVASILRLQDYVRELVNRKGRIPAGIRPFLFKWRLARSKCVPYRTRLTRSVVCRLLSTSAASKMPGQTLVEATSALCPH